MWCHNRIRCCDEYDESGSWCDLGRGSDSVVSDLAVVMGLKESGASKIIGVDINESKFKLAREFGCTHFVNPKKLKEGQTTVEAICALIGDYPGCVRTTPLSVSETS